MTENLEQTPEPSSGWTSSLAKLAYTTFCSHQGRGGDAKDEPAWQAVADAVTNARITELEAEVTKWSCSWCEANARVADLEAEKQEFANFQLHEVVELRDRIGELEAERANIVRQYDENLDSGLRLADQLDVANARVHDLEDTDARATKIIEQYRKLHVDQHQQLHKLQAELAYWRPAEQSASRLVIKSSLELEAARDRIAQLETPPCSPSTSPQA